jgi:hypothetical protein
MSRPVLVFGATGVTGRLVVDSLLALGVSDVVLGGRDHHKLEALSRQTGLPFRVANAEHPETLSGLTRGMHVVVSTAGPFLRFGEPLVRAAIEARAHFLDTTGEQAYMRRILEAYDPVATDRRLAIVNAQAFEFALGYCVAASLTEEHGPPAHGGRLQPRGGRGLHARHAEERAARAATGAPRAAQSRPREPRSLARAAPRAFPGRGRSRRARRAVPRRRGPCICPRSRRSSAT